MSFGHNKKTKKKEAWNVKESVLRPETDPFGRVDLDPRAFDRLIEQKGVQVKVFRSMYCPKVKSVDGSEHQIDCTLCNGSSFIDLEPICVKAFIQSQNLEMINSQQGIIDGNTVMITFPTGIELQYFTKIELEDFTQIYYQRIMRKPGGNVDVLKYRACRVNVIIDENAARYYQEQDFTIDPNGNILWGVRKPVDNIIYSIHYETKVQFRAVKASHVNRFSQYKNDGVVENLKFPEQWQCTKEFLVKRLDLNGNEMEQGPFDQHTIVTDNS